MSSIVRSRACVDAACLQSLVERTTCVATERAHRPSTAARARSSGCRSRRARRRASGTPAGRGSSIAPRRRSPPRSRSPRASTVIVTSPVRSLTEKPSNDPFSVRPSGTCAPCTALRAPEPVARQPAPRQARAARRALPCRRRRSRAACLPRARAACRSRGQCAQQRQPRVTVGLHLRQRQQRAATDHRPASASGLSDRIRLLLRRRGHRVPPSHRAPRLRVAGAGPARRRARTTTRVSATTTPPRSAAPASAPGRSSSLALAG